MNCSEKEKYLYGMLNPIQIQQKEIVAKNCDNTKNIARHLNSPKALNLQ
jgi:hypothetical protein